MIGDDTTTGVQKGWKSRERLCSEGSGVQEEISEIESPAKGSTSRIIPSFMGSACQCKIALTSR